MPEGDPLANASELPVDVLADRDLITSEEGIAPQWHQAIGALCRSAGFDPRVTQRTNDWGAMLALVASGLGVAIVSSTLAQVRFPALKFVPLTGAAAIGSFWVASHEDATDPTVRLLLSELIGSTAEAGL